MTEKRPLTSEEISALVKSIADEFASEDRKKWKCWQRCRQASVGLSPIEKPMRFSDLRDKLRKDFPELSLPEINMKVLRSLTPVRMGKSYTEPAYHEHFG